jgi:hypothetical protein
MQKMSKDRLSASAAWVKIGIADECLEHAETAL